MFLLLDPLVDSWLFMQSPAPVIGILVLYLYFVLKLGPQLMKDRAALNLQKVLIVYNAYQVIFSIWLCRQAFHVDNVFTVLFKQCSNVQSNRVHAALVSTTYKVNKKSFNNSIILFSFPMVLGGISSQK